MVGGLAAPAAARQLDGAAYHRAMQPTRLSIMTLNLWKTFRWPDRREALQNMLRTFQPDVLCVQELRPATLEALQEALPGHGWIQDDAFAGWTDESNLLWRRTGLHRVEHGVATINDLQALRQLFWVRLKTQTGQTLLVATAHYTWPGHAREQNSRQSPRPEQAGRTAAALGKLANEGEAVFFMGDLNDDYYPRKILSDAGFVDPFTRLQIPQEPTRPARPIDFRPDAVHDWIMANGHARPVAAQVVRHLHEGLPPSDHWPVLAVYEI